MPKPNQQLIADRLNLSRTTVSRCFTHHPRINPETRAKVFQLANELGYDYSIPRNFELKTEVPTDRVEVLVGVPESRKEQVLTASAVFEGIVERAAAEKMQIGLQYLDPSEYLPHARARKVLPGVKASDLKGLIMVYAFEEQAVQNLMRRLPVVSVFEDYDNVNVDCVNPDQIRGITQMVEHLVRLEHKKIGFLSWKYRVPAPWAERRLGAYLECLFRFNLSFDSSNILNMHREEDVSAVELAEIVYKKIGEGVRAWVCAADHQAYDLIERLLAKGVRIPEDVSITGFDGVAVPEGLPQVTTFKVPFKELGISALLSIKRRQSHPAAARRHVLVDGEFMEGETTARLLK